MIINKSIIGILFVTILSSCGNNVNDSSSSDVEGTAATLSTNGTPTIAYTILNQFPHDTSSYTQGLFIKDNQLFESTGSGSNDRYISWAGPVDLKTGKADRKIILDKKYFGEGSVILNGKLFQLTWQNRVGFVYDAKTFKKISEFPYPGEGWGLTHDTTYLIMTDGTNRLQFLDPSNLRVIKIVGVEDHNGPVANLNESEYIDGYLYVNQYQTHYILKIDPATGKVVGRLDLTNLYNEAKAKFSDSQETNGIAYDPLTKKIYVTGKCWPSMYEIKLN